MFFLFFICFTLLLLIIILRQSYLDLIYPKHLHASQFNESLGEKIELYSQRQRKVSGFFQLSTQATHASHRRVILLIHSHLHETSQLFPLIHYFNQLGFDTFAYQTQIQSQPTTFGFGHIDFEGDDCLTFIKWYQDQHPHEHCQFSGFGIDSGATTLIQLAKSGQEFDFLILEQLPLNLPTIIERQLKIVIPHFWLRLFITKLLTLWFKIRHSLVVRDLTNLTPCPSPILLFHSTEHPLNSAADNYRFLPYYNNMRAFNFSTNYFNSAVYSEPERYFFLIDTFLNELHFKN
ncbi:MAG: hypothetical protein ACRDCC_00315 [Culicoidibacterales bacterium]